ncbi:PAC2 family protein [Schaalia sp. ZJ405]|uniref:proteasome assembly chaperone family protein n=1 Tax=Schaalia sp. ZJ405 TaxID=2709403 RepID=UPI0013EC4C44|nr:PAC2 family protein [Schaalia sp. ZJ405]QPK82191.1 PAC2 family protein [Schaalia sp. ZJ405]
MGPAQGARSRILLVQFDGAMDAGLAGRIAVSQLLRSLPVERVATFDSDFFIDYRSHRPIITLEDWVTADMETRQIVLDVVRDDLGQPILLLHGPEPDAKWETFARIVASLAHDAGVEIVFSIHGIPSGVPHTRPVPVHVQATDRSLIPEQPHMANIMQFPAPATSFLQTRLAEQGMNGVTLLGAVPYYMTETPYPAAASALLGSISDMTDLSLPVGDLEQGAAKDQTAIRELVEEHPEISQTVSALEEHYDAWAGDDGTAIPLNALDQNAPLGVASKQSKDIGDVIEAYLANVSRLNVDEDSSDSSAHQPETPEAVEAPSNTLEAALRRVRQRQESPETYVRPSSARHRAPESADVEDAGIPESEGFTGGEQPDERGRAADSDVSAEE